MTEREKIFGRISEALQAKAPLPGHGHDAIPAKVSGAAAPSSQARKWLPAVGESFDDRLAAFQKNAAELKADFWLLNHADEISGKLSELKQAGHWKKIASHNSAATNAGCGGLGLPICWTDAGYDVKELESCDAGITECDALVAQTGSVLLTSRSAGGRALSVLPPHHVVLARREQLVRDLPEAFALLKRTYAGNYPSMISFVTGPSRTGDIERILVLGAHGPKRLSILCY